MKAASEGGAQQLTGTYMKQVEDRKDTMEALSADGTLI